MAHLTVSKIGHKPKESITVTCDKGVLTFNGTEIILYFEPAVEKTCLCFNSSQQPGYRTDIELLFADFHQEICSITSLADASTVSPRYSNHQIQDLVVTQILRDMYDHQDNSTNGQEPS